MQSVGFHRGIFMRTCVSAHFASCPSSPKTVSLPPDWAAVISFPSYFFSYFKQMFLDSYPLSFFAYSKPWEERIVSEDAERCSLLWLWRSRTAATEQRWKPRPGILALGWLWKETLMTEASLSYAVNPRTPWKHRRNIGSSDPPAWTCIICSPRVYWGNT